MMDRAEKRREFFRERQRAYMRQAFWQSCLDDERIGWKPATNMSSAYQSWYTLHACKEIR